MGKEGITNGITRITKGSTGIRKGNKGITKGREKWVISETQLLKRDEFKRVRNWKDYKGNQRDHEGSN